MLSQNQGLVWPKDVSQAGVLTQFPREGMGTGGAGLVACSGRGYVTIFGENYYVGNPTSSALPLPMLPSWT